VPKYDLNTEKSPGFHGYYNHDGNLTFGRYPSKAFAINLASEEKING
jgi:hypothetical protein